MKAAELLLDFDATHRRRTGVRWYARGRAWASEHADVAARITASARPWSGEWSVTSWPRITATYSGTAERSGSGRMLFGPLSEHAEWRREQAAIVRKKGDGPTLAHGLSAFKGGSDAEATARTGLLLDYDGGDSAGWERARDLLGGLALLAQRRPAAGKFHLELPFSEHLIVDGVSDKAAWASGFGWVVGVMSELIYPGDRYRRFDPLTDRLLQPVYVATRRTDEDPVPETYYSDGPALNWLALLAALEFPVGILAEEETRSVPEQREPAAPLGVEADAIVEALIQPVSCIGFQEHRWRMYLALAGALRTLGVEEDSALDALEELSRRAGQDDEALTRNRVRCALGTYSKPDHTIGFNTLRLEFPGVAAGLKKLIDTQRASVRAALTSEDPE